MLAPPAVRIFPWVSPISSLAFANNGRRLRRDRPAGLLFPRPRVTLLAGCLQAATDALDQCDRPGAGTGAIAVPRTRSSDRPPHQQLTAIPCRSVLPPARPEGRSLEVGTRGHDRRDPGCSHGASVGSSGRLRFIASRPTAPATSQAAGATRTPAFDDGIRAVPNRGQMNGKVGIARSRTPRS